MTVPDVAGFIDADKRHRASLGSPVVFKVPVTKTWPEETKINPDTGEPYDSTIQPTSAPFTEVTKTCHVVLKQASPLRPQSDTQSTAVGEMSGMDVIIDLAAADYADVKDASEMQVNTLNYRIRERKPFSLSDQLYRWLIYGMER